jgi:hypothetical protein
VSGTAELTSDRERIRRLWKPECRTWFPLGAEDPDLALLRVRVDRAEYWDAPNGRVVHLLTFEHEPAPSITDRIGESRAGDDLGQRGWEREQSGRLLLHLEHLFLMHAGRPH